ncbi:MAG: hypothetical protein V4635_11805, partial [Bacteroidota bacterium]
IAIGTGEYDPHLRWGPILLRPLQFKQKRKKPCVEIHGVFCFTIFRLSGLNQCPLQPHTEVIPKTLTLLNPGDLPGLFFTAKFKHDQNQRRDRQL